MRFLLASTALLAALTTMVGCGARTPLTDPSDTSDGGSPTDTPVGADTPVGLDLPFVEDLTPPPDLPVFPDIPTLSDGALCPPQTVPCQGACVNLQSNNDNCGACGVSCPVFGGLQCQFGRCLPLRCRPGQVLCNGVCADTQFDVSNCGFCGNTCAPGSACARGTCVSEGCGAGLTSCAGVCIDPALDPANCGACGRRCIPGQTCTMGACTAAMPLGGPPFRITTLGGTVCRTAEDMTLANPTDGIAVGPSGLYVMGRDQSARFDPGALTGSGLMPTYVGFTSNLHTGAVYTLAQGMIPYGLPTAAVAVDTLMELDPMTLGFVRALHLSPRIPVPPVSPGANVGIFAGYDRIVIHTGVRVYNIDLPSGTVTDLGPMAVPPHARCASGVYYGVAEFIRGAVFLDMVQMGTSLVRVRVPDGFATGLTPGGTPPLNNACGFTVSPSLNRWYWHSGPGTSVSSLGFCDASFDLTPSVAPYTLTTPPTSVGWTDACALPGHRTFLPNTDDGSATDTLPFAFRYWSFPLSAGAPVNLCSNGWMGLDGMMNNSLGGRIPDPAAPNSVLAPHWGDNYTRMGGICTAAVGTAPMRSYVVEWNDSHYCCSDDPSVHLSFEAILYETSNAIDFLYNDMRGARSETVGIENRDGSDGVSVCSQGGPCTVTTGTRIRFVPTAP